MRIRTYGVVRGVMLKHPPTRLFLLYSHGLHTQPLPRTSYIPVKNTLALSVF